MSLARTGWTGFTYPSAPSAPSPSGRCTDCSSRPVPRMTPTTRCTCLRRQRECAGASSWDYAGPPTRPNRAWTCSERPFACANNWCATAGRPGSLTTSSAIPSAISIWTPTSLKSCVDTAPIFSRTVAGGLGVARALPGVSHTLRHTATQYKRLAQLQAPARARLPANRFSLSRPALNGGLAGDRRRREPVRCFAAARPQGPAHDGQPVRSPVPRSRREMAQRMGRLVLGELSAAAADGE